MTTTTLAGTNCAYNIATETLRSWSEIHSYSKPGWLYRGEKCASWSLKTSFERCWEREEFGPKERRGIEDHLLRDFQRAYHLYGRYIPESDSILEWFSLMQHHGAPTRLLDFTYSIYVAAYFALENARLTNAESACAIWAVCGPWLEEQSINVYCRKGKTKATGLKTETKKIHEKIASDLLFKKPFVKAALQLIPFRLSERLRTQRGTFLVPGDLSDTFMSNIGSLKGHDKKENILKIIIPAELRREAIEQLFIMNISRTSLFPGLDGYSQSLGVFHPSFRPDSLYASERPRLVFRAGF